MLPYHPVATSRQEHSARLRWISTQSNDIEPWITDYKYETPQFTSNHCKTEETPSPTMLRFLATVRPRNKYRISMKSQNVQAELEAGLLRRGDYDEGNSNSNNSPQHQLTSAAILPPQIPLPPPTPPPPLPLSHHQHQQLPKKPTASVELTKHNISLELEGSPRPRRDPNVHKLQKLLKLKQKVRRKNMSLAVDYGSKKMEGCSGWPGGPGPTAGNIQQRQVSKVDITVINEQPKKKPKNTFTTIAELLRERMREREEKQYKKEHAAGAGKADELRSLLRNYENRRAKGDLPRLKLGETFTGRICHPHE